MKKMSDLTPYTNILPYASEIFGVYQPMLGWRSKRTLARVQKGFANDVSRQFNSLYRRFRGQFEFATAPTATAAGQGRPVPQIRFLRPGTPDTSRGRTSGSFVVDAIAGQLPKLETYDESIWDEVIRPERIQATLNEEIIPKLGSWYATDAKQPNRQNADLLAMLADQLDTESTTAGYLLYLKDNKQFDKLKEFFYKPALQMAQLSHILQLMAFKDPFEYFDPFKDLDRVSLSPIGIVHLFRQYFFEFDTFLGPPVSHVWLSPGATVELLEIQTRKTVIEKTFESEFETVIKTEKSLTEEDEISDAVKQDNKSDIKFGMNASAEQSWVGGSASASSSIDVGETQSKARETTHRHMRQQSEKLSTEIRRNYKSTFKTVSEVTDTSSKRYVLSNTTDKLINYELRRKMRQVGVQVQDIGTYLCWQTYVDDPGRQLGIAKLVHIAKSPEVGNAPPPEAVPMPQPIVTSLDIDIPFVAKSEDALLDDDDGYKNGKEVNEDFNDGEAERIEDDFGPYEMLCEQPGYRYGQFEFDYKGTDATIDVRNLTEDPAGKIRFNIHLDYIHFHGVSPKRVTAKVTWQPSTESIDKINATNQQKISEFNEQSKYEHQKAFVEAARERIKLMGEVQPRKFEDLREEERIVVYRSLIQGMLTKDIPMPDDRTRHVVAELLNTIFDVDKMLYFVAPEWWRPRLHRSHQALGGIRTPAAGTPAPAPAPAKSNTVYAEVKLQAAANTVSGMFKPVEDKQIAPMDIAAWGGTNENRVDNYYITEESEPAKLGASLGWLLQLDGDNLRNSFLNAPWVKAVIPIRPGKERAAMNWLQRTHVEGTDGLDDKYVAPPDQLAGIPHAGPHVTIRDAINHLCDVVAEKHRAALTVSAHPTDEINDDNKVSATPVDKVYEHGFYPLQGGFRVMPSENFEVFDQWVEVLPTDQVVPVEVTYDPKTGRQI